MISFISSAVTVQVTCADMAGFLGKLTGSGIAIHELKYLDLLTVTLVIDKKDLNLSQNIGCGCGAVIKVIHKWGLYWTMYTLLQRPVLVAGLCVLLLLSVWLPTKVLFVSVDGNETIPDRLIIEQANRCGIVFGASRREVRSEKMKNSLLSAIPDLQWAGINTSGCTAIISVKERSQMTQENAIGTVSSIVAVRDGVIESCTSLKGSMQCKIGQAVTKGQVLISGYTDFGLCINATRAEGEVYAQTKHEITAFQPVNYVIKGEPKSVQKNYGLLIGKKRINFTKDSGISGAGCDRIYFDNYVTLPGGFTLPIAFFVNITTDYEHSAISTSTENSAAITEQTARQYLLTHMVSGKILRENTSFSERDGVCILSGRYVCSEMIGRVQHEEIYEDYGKNN